MDQLGGMGFGPKEMEEKERHKTGSTVSPIGPKWWYLLESLLESLVSFFLVFRLFLENEMEDGMKGIE